MPIKSHEIPSFSRAMQTYGTVCKLLGAFLEPSALWAQLKAALDAECAMDPGGGPGGGALGGARGVPGKTTGLFLGNMEETGRFLREV